MKKSIRTLNYLKSQDGYVSGEKLAESLQISRTSIWKQINELRGLGYEIEASSRNGYRLVKVPDRLYPWEVEEGLKTQCIGRKYIYEEDVSSTMDELWRRALDDPAEGTVVLAESQKKGRGRLRRSWVTPRYKGLYFSCLLVPQLPLSVVSQLTLMVGLACVKALENCADLPFRLKWPNDIYVNEKKLCGILTELNVQPDGMNFVVVGIGLNVNASDTDLLPIATSLCNETGITYDRVKVLHALLASLEDYYFSFCKKGFQSMRDQWNALSLLKGKEVTVEMLNRIFSGVAGDVEDDGALLVETDNGLERVIAGDVFKCKSS